MELYWICKECDTTNSYPDAKVCEVCGAQISYDQEQRMLKAGGIQEKNQKTFDNPYIDFLLSKRQCKGIQELINQGIPINDDQNFKNAYLISTKDEKAELNFIADKVLLSCHFRFLNYAFDKDEFYMRHWAAHYEKFGDNEIIELHKFILNNGGIGKRNASFPGICLKLCEIYSRIGSDNSKLADFLDQYIKALLDKLSNYMQMIEQCIRSNNVRLITHAPSETNKLADSLKYLNKIVANVFDVSSKDIEVEKKIRISPKKKSDGINIYPDLDSLRWRRDISREHLLSMGIQIKTPEELKAIDAYLKGEELDEKTIKAMSRIKIYNVFGPLDAYKFKELIDIWADPIGTFTEKSGFNINGISFNDGYSNVPAERYIAAGEMLLTYNISNNHFIADRLYDGQIVEKCFKSALDLGGEEYKDKIYNILVKKIKKDSNSNEALSLALKFFPNDSYLNWQYILYVTNNLTYYGDEPKIDEEYNRFMSGYGGYYYVAKQFENQLNKAEKFKPDMIERVGKNLENTINISLIYKEQWDDYLLNMDKFYNSIAEDINQKTKKINAKNKIVKFKEKIINVARVLMGLFIIALSLLPVFFISYLNKNPDILNAVTTLSPEILLCITTIIICVIQIFLGKIHFINRKKRKMGIVSVISLIISILVIGFIIYTFGGFAF